MGKAVLRGLLCGICTVIYIFAILISVYFNLIPERYTEITELVMPIGCVIILPVFLEKSRISRFLMSALFFAAALSAGVWLGLKYNIPGLLFRVFYGFMPQGPAGDGMFAVFFGAAGAIVLGLALSFVISAVCSARAKTK